MTKVYFPRLVIPIAAVLPASSILRSLVVLLALMLGLRRRPGAHDVWSLPLACAGVHHGARRRPVARGAERPLPGCRYLVPFLLQVWLFATPVAYPSSLLESRGARCTPSTPWSASSRGSAGRSSARRPRRGHDPRVERGRRAAPRDRGRVLPARRGHVRGRRLMPVAIHAEGLGKEYVLGRPAGYETLRERSSLGRRAGRVAGHRSCSRPTTGAAVGAARRVVRDRPGRGRRHHRRQRRRQEHAAQDPVADHGADDRQRAASTAASVRYWRSGRASTQS